MANDQCDLDDYPLAKTLWEYSQMVTKLILAYAILQALYGEIDKIKQYPGGSDCPRTPSDMSDTFYFIGERDEIKNATDDDEVAI